MKSHLSVSLEINVNTRDNNKDIPRKEELGYVVDRVSKSTLEGGRDK